MKSVSKIAALGLLLTAASLSPAQAHHSGAMYDMTKIITINGTVKAFNWVNPHISVEILADAKDGEPATLWNIAASSPGVMSRSGWSKATLQAGDRLTLDFNPLKDGGKGGNIKKAILPNGKAFGWSF